MSLHIVIAGPIASADVAQFLDDPSVTLPIGYAGAPILGTLIGELLHRGHRVSAVTLSRDLPLRADVTANFSGPKFALACCPMRPKAWPMNGRLLGRIVDLYRFERRALQAAIAAANADVVHAHWAYEFACAAVASGTPHVVTCHDAPFVVARFQRDFRHGGYRWLRAGMAWHVLRRAKHVTAVSPYLVERVQGLCRVPVRMVPNPMPRDAFNQQRSGADHPPRIAMVANGWSALKNPQAAFKAFSLLSHQMPQAELHVMGQDFGPYQTAQGWWNAEKLQGKVLFHGEVRHDALLSQLAASDLLLHPSLEESFGAAPAEALAMGLPVVGGLHSGAVPWVVGDGGLLVDVTRPQAIAQAMHDLLSNRVLANKLGHQGREQTLARFSAAAVASLYEAAYASAINACELKKKAVA